MGVAGGGSEEENEEELHLVECRGEEGRGGEGSLVLLVLQRDRHRRYLSLIQARVRRKRTLT
jgi:hypothetical protein